MQRDFHLMEGILYSPRVVYNENTATFVLWFNWITSSGFSGSFYAVATSATPEGMSVVVYVNYLRKCICVVLCFPFPFICVWCLACNYLFLSFSFEIILGPFVIVNSNVTLAWANMGDFGLMVDDDEAHTAYVIYTAHITAPISNHLVSVERVKEVIALFGLSFFNHISCLWLDISIRLTRMFYSFLSLIFSSPIFILTPSFYIQLAPDYLSSMGSSGNSKYCVCMFCVTHVFVCAQKKQTNKQKKTTKQNENRNLTPCIKVASLAIHFARRLHCSNAMECTML